MISKYISMLILSNESLSPGSDFFVGYVLPASVGLAGVEGRLGPDRRFLGFVSGVPFHWFVKDRYDMLVSGLGWVKVDEETELMPWGHSWSGFQLAWRSREYWNPGKRPDCSYMQLSSTLIQISEMK